MPQNETMKNKFRASQSSSLSLSLASRKSLAKLSTKREDENQCAKYFVNFDNRKTFIQNFIREERSPNDKRFSDQEKKFWRDET